MNGDYGFYVGYLARAPRELSRWVRMRIVVLALIVSSAALLLVFAQRPFATSTFEFQEYRLYTGVVFTQPYPVLYFDTGPAYLLVNPGKHGATIAPGRVRLAGARISRDVGAMLELRPDSVQPAESGAPAPERVALGHVALTGEIVDSKCYLGAMNPGEGKVHRDCAARCISGGIPAAFIARDSRGQTQFILLTGAGGRALSRDVLDYVAEPVRIAGALTRIGSMLTLSAEPATYRRAHLE